MFGFFDRARGVLSSACDSIKIALGLDSVEPIYRYQVQRHLAAFPEFLFYIIYTIVDHEHITLSDQLKRSIALIAIMSTWYRGSRDTEILLIKSRVRAFSRFRLEDIDDNSWWIHQNIALNFDRVFFYFAIDRFGILNATAIRHTLYDEGVLQNIFHSTGENTPPLGVFILFCYVAIGIRPIAKSCARMAPEYSERYDGDLGEDPPFDSFSLASRLHFFRISAFAVLGISLTLILSLGSIFLDADTVGIILFSNALVLILCDLIFSLPNPLEYVLDTIFHAAVYRQVSAMIADAGEINEEEDWTLFSLTMFSCLMRLVINHPLNRTVQTIDPEHNYVLSGPAPIVAGVEWLKQCFSRHDHYHGIHSNPVRDEENVVEVEHNTDHAPRFR